MPIDVVLAQLCQEPCGCRVVRACERVCSTRCIVDCRAQGKSLSPAGQLHSGCAKQWCLQQFVAQAGAVDSPVALELQACHWWTLVERVIDACAGRSGREGSRQQGKVHDAAEDEGERMGQYAVPDSAEFRRT